MNKSLDKSAVLFQEAQEHLVGGVNSPVRAFKSVGGSPLFMERGEGPYIFDVDGNRYIDYVGSYGPLILGHCPEKVQEALRKAVEKGTTFGASTEGEVRLAELVKEAFPHMDKVRFVNSGTEALMSAIRLARAFTGRTKIIKFAGCYHGHSDFLLAQAGSGVLTLSLPGSAGVPENMVRDTLIAGYNDPESVEVLFEHNPGEIAAIVVEPVPGNIGVVLPENDFLKRLREIASANGAVLIFDEVMSGFRQNFGGAQKYYGVTPDITCLGKIIGGGLPVGAYGARAEIIDMVAPLGPMYQAGTLSGNPLAMAAGIAMLEALHDGTVYDELNQNTDRLALGILEIGKKHGIPVRVATFGSMITPFFTDTPVRDYNSAIQSDTKRFGAFFWKMIEAGIFLPPSQFEAWFVSTEHGEGEINATLNAIDGAFKNL